MDTRHPPPPARAESGNGLTVFATVVQELLDAGPEDFAGGVQEIDRDLRGPALVGPRPIHSANRRTTRPAVHS
ncbi:hypothetical protein OHB41_47365 [Streptomyces sp. NBC_01571]|uniref:hypothetical protein n=1 Tax=Streptomyces sp. NBC_01571 TaxID=2975883 RepID=UPI00225B1934|nr:hypothetical protein [Streptomyces sp. NBC_01571]MCX4580627.1 hypothetical protein [Streptomyces sp. NBC_01571]